MKMSVPTKEELLRFANVPVKLAATYLGVTEQVIRCRVRAEGKDHLPIGVPNGSRCIISPQKLIAFKETIGEQERVSAELKTIGKFLETGMICFDDVLELAVHRAKGSQSAEEINL